MILLTFPTRISKSQWAQLQNSPAPYRKSQIEVLKLQMSPSQILQISKYDKKPVETVFFVRNHLITQEIVFNNTEGRSSVSFLSGFWFSRQQEPVFCEILRYLWWWEFYFDLINLKWWPPRFILNSLKSINQFKF